jgi:hypothetical protein
MSEHKKVRRSAGRRKRGIFGLKEKEFERLIGLKKKVFEKLYEILQRAQWKQFKGARRSELSVLERWVVALKYWRYYPSQAQLALEYGVSEDCIYRSIRWVENVLVKHQQMRIDKTGLGQAEAVILDTTEIRLQRPEKKRTKNLLQWEEEVSHDEDAGGGGVAYDADWIGAIFRGQSA